MEKERSTYEKLSSWVRNSVTLKLITITILMLLLLIPTGMIDGIIYERQNLQQQAFDEVSSLWARSQRITGPILSVPVAYENQHEDKVTTFTKLAYILPDKLAIEGTISPEVRYRGIYDVVVYNSNLKISGQFKINLQPKEANFKKILWEEASITFGVSDMRGINNEMVARWDSKELAFESGSSVPNIIPKGIHLPLDDLDGQTDQSIPFDFDLSLKGSGNMSFVPVGKTTTVQIRSPWNSPSFQGNFLPDSREVTKEGFTAQWQVLELNRSFPQTWMNKDYSSNMAESAFGVDLFVPMDNYKKSIRSSKYSVMTIALTFLIFFLMEILNKKKIHPLQYILVGLALSLFYVLLVSISEHSSFKTAFLISTAAIVTMTALYSLSVFKNKKQSFFLIGALLSIYGFVFVTITLTDYALLMGSIGLTLILGATMYYTRNIDWYNMETED